MDNNLISDKYAFTITYKYKNYANSAIITIFCYYCDKNVFLILSENKYMYKTIPPTTAFDLKCVHCDSLSKREFQDKFDIEFTKKNLAWIYL